MNHVKKLCCGNFWYMKRVNVFYGNALTATPLSQQKNKDLSRESADVYCEHNQEKDCHMYIQLY